MTPEQQVVEDVKALIAKLSVKEQAVVQQYLVAIRAATENPYGVMAIALVGAELAAA